MILIEPINRLIFRDRAIKGERVKGKYFGGFCTCGGIMYQKSWFAEDGKLILVSECEKCWKNEAMVFNNNTPVGQKEEVKTIERPYLEDVLEELLSPSEFEAVMAKARGENYNPTAFSRAKKRLSDFNLDLDEILSYL
ncbi:hypothetical protein Asulf_00813 [Archaeoglobus sulfaticallidus PM70-1]|uniref:Uncharacterized protein n=1 Tax=Archaeoglobus sulfaticallidus PM70-1 TaxID=387631 RepID=N0BEX2_9EURY|nr:hypothetical protein [Archaeoglobus sulfaticallidus]AGK60822.1 hypothetical protein Asulf_00813 [Archaeoglobus sulfaticallidus PM70-1]